MGQIKKKVLLVSHERSGTHWLMNTITSNFLMEDPLIHPAHIDLDQRDIMYCDPFEMREALTKIHSGEEYTVDVYDTPIKNPFKSHHTYEFFENIWKYVLDQYHVFYIARDGRDVMTSFWRHCWKNTGMGPRTFTVGQFMRERPGYPCSRYHGKGTPQNMIDRWRYHLLSWIHRKGVFFLTYEDLHKDFKGVVSLIAEYMEMELPDKIYAPGIAGVTPWKGQIDNWKHYFKPEDETFFSEDVSLVDLNATEIHKEMSCLT